MQKYYKSCVSPQTGEAEDCVLAPGNSYIQCVGDDDLGEITGNCKHLELCPDELSQRDCSGFDLPAEQEACVSQQKWCPQYTIETSPADEPSNLGYIPLTHHCITRKGAFTQELDVVVPVDGSSTSETGNCYFGDGVTLVNRQLEGDYASCGCNEVCNTTFQGGYYSPSYDPRYRPWYITTKQIQRSNWSPPYTFFFDYDVGFTFSSPIYSTQHGKQVFAGVLAVDYRCKCVQSIEAVLTI